MFFSKERGPPTQNSEACCFDLDELLPQVGEFGRYQQLLVWLVCLPACIPCGFCAFNQLFMSDVPDHWCFVPELVTPGVSPRDRRRIAIPKMVRNSIYMIYIQLNIARNGSLDYNAMI